LTRILTSLTPVAHLADCASSRLCAQHPPRRLQQTGHHPLTPLSRHCCRRVCRSCWGPHSQWAATTPPGSPLTGPPPSHTAWRGHVPCWPWAPQTQSQQPPSLSWLLHAGARLAEFTNTEDLSCWVCTCAHRRPSMQACESLKVCIAMPAVTPHAVHPSPWSTGSARRQQLCCQGLS
jgi:hypothetical protein